MRKKCIFCQRDNQKITNEHIFPDWLSKFYGADAMCLNEGRKEDGTVTFSYASKIFQQTRNDVCTECNSGWMSAIENAAQPILVKMLKGKSLVLDKKKQEKIATWAMKTILVINHHNPAPPAKQFIPEEHYAAFFEAKSVTPGNVMLLGYKPGTKFKTGDSIANNRLDLAQHIAVPKDKLEELKAKLERGQRAYGATLRIANIVFQLVGNDLYDVKTHRLDMMIPQEPMRILNPYKNKIRWPLPHSIDEVGGLEVVHNALKGAAQ